MLPKLLYGYPVLGRYGLGNMLYPWARCFIWCQDNHVPMIAPRWTYIRIGPYLRHEKDKRNYQRLFHSQGYITGVKRLWILMFCTKIPEDKVTKIIHSDLFLNSSRKKVVRFKGMRDFFTPLKSRHEDLYRELKRITKPGLIKSSPADQFIGIHVRRGDYSKPSEEALLRAGHPNYRIPITWYVSILNSLRSNLGHLVSYVFSDGTTDELAPLLCLPDTILIQGGSAITDLLALSSSSVMIASGSTFSMWASFLGQVPCIWYPGQRWQFVIKTNTDVCLEPEMDVDASFSYGFLDVVLNRIVNH